jgi:threonine dehydratase
MEIHAFDQPETLHGAGTLGRELDDIDPDTVLVAVGGGGLIGGVAAWFENAVRVVGVKPELAPTLSTALAAGRVVDAPVGGIAADSLAPRRVGELMFPIAQRCIDRVVLVPDDAIAEAQSALWRVLRVAAEPGGAAALAALLHRAYVPRPGERVAVVISGGNTAQLTW